MRKLSCHQQRHRRLRASVRSGETRIVAFRGAAGHVRLAVTVVRDHLDHVKVAHLMELMSDTFAHSVTEHDGVYTHTFRVPGA